MKMLNPRIYEVCVAAVFVLGSSTAHGYNYHLDRDVMSLVSEGMRLAHRYQTADQNQHALMQEKLTLDQEHRALNTKQAAYDKQASEHERRVTEQNKSLQQIQNNCNNQDIEKNTSQQINQCSNTAKKLNVENHSINQEAGTLNTEKQTIISETENFDRKAAQWNQHQMATVSAFNDSSYRLNDWLNRAYAFMNTADFQGNITWAHAGKLCADYNSRTNTPPEQALLDEARHALACLNHVENARKNYYKKSR